MTRPEVEVVGDDLRVWQDGGPHRHRGRWAGLHVDMARSALPELLKRAQRDLPVSSPPSPRGPSGPGLGQPGIDLAEAIDNNFTIM